MNKFTVGVIIVLLALFCGVIYWSTNMNNRPAEIGGYDSHKLIGPSEDNGNIGDHVHGKEDSPVVFVEYADLQCPGCASTYPVILDLLEEYGDRVAFTYRNFPIASIHPNARAAATAAESAGFQGYYWETLEVLYSNRDEWINLTGSDRTDKFAELFKRAAPDGDVDKFRTDMADKNIEKKINFDYNLGTKQDNITATPAFLVNGKSVDMNNVSTQDDIKNQVRALLDEELKKNNMEAGPKKTSSKD